MKWCVAGTMSSCQSSRFPKLTLSASTFRAALTLLWLLLEGKSLSMPLESLGYLGQVELLEELAYRG